MKKLSDSSNVFADFEHDDVEVLQAVYENNWKIFSYLKATIKATYFELLQSIIVKPLQWIPLKGTDKRKGVPIFCLETCGHFEEARTRPELLLTPAVAVHHTLTALCSHWSFPDKTLEKAPLAHCLKARRCVNNWVDFWSIFSCHLGKQYLHKDRLLIT